MKALTLWQPYAQLMAIGVKSIETRSWRAPDALIGQRIVIHASAKRPKDIWRHVQSEHVFPAHLAPLYDYGRHVDPQESGDGEWWRYRWAGPLGAVVGSGVLTACVPMVATRDYALDNGSRSLIVDPRGLVIFDPAAAFARDAEQLVDDQLPFGIFEPGRWAWLFDDLVKLDRPIAAKGKQRIWNWDGAA